jgi:hypothetical protein
MFSGEATNTNFIAFGLTRQGHEPTIYRTRVEHANHYTTYANLITLSLYFKIFMKFKTLQSNPYMFAML